MNSMQQTDISGVSDKEWISKEQLSNNVSQEYAFDLFVAGMTIRSQRAINNVKRMFEESFKDRYKLRVIDIFQQPSIAKSEQVFAVPLLIIKSPTPKRMFIGDMITSDLIRNREVDAFFIPEDDGGKVYVLEGASQIYRHLVEEMQEGCLTVALDGTILFSNRNFAEIVKTPIEFLVGQSIHEFLSPLDQEFINTLLSLSQDHFKTELILITKYKNNVPVLISASHYHYDNENFINMVVTDLTELKRSNHLNALVFEQAASPKIVCDQMGKVIKVNPAAMKLFGKDLHDEVFDRVVPLYTEDTDTRFLIKEALKKGPVYGQEVIFDSHFYLIVNASYLYECLPGEHPNDVGFLITIVDITENRKYRQEISRLDRLNLVGQMAAGIGHEVRNPMTTVRGYLQLLGIKPEFQAHDATLKIMIEELDRANTIIEEFLSLARDRKTKLELHDINSIISKLYPLIEADTFTQNKQICFIPGEVPEIMLNDKEISQLILNLTRNGLEAMEVRGHLTIQTYVENNNVVLTVQDEGHGISPENISKLGMPFFTTKSQGTGLGLATCYQIAASHDASIDVKSNSDGTTFSIRFKITQPYLVARLSDFVVTPCYVSD